MPNLTVADLPKAVAEHQAALGLDVLMDHGWIVTFSDKAGHQFSMMADDGSEPMNPAVSIFVDDVSEVLNRVRAAGLEIVYPLTEEPWGVTRFLDRDGS